MNANEWKVELALEPHPEGGHFHRFFASPVTVRTARGERPTMTAIHYLLEAGEYSAWHRLKSHELWHWHDGGPLLIHCLDDAGLTTHRLGPGGRMTLPIAPGIWFASEPAVGTDFALVSCTVSPGFDFADFEWGDAGELARTYPDNAQLIEHLRRGQ